VGTRISPLAGQQARIADLVDASRLVDAYYRLQPDPSVPAQRVAFGTSGHRGSSFERTFNERHVVAITQAICEQRKRAGVDGPLFIGIDTHALSVPAFENAMEVLAANDVDVMIAQDGEFTPTPAISHAILAYNRGRQRGLVDGIVMTPSHNPPDNGGFKYNPANGGPADTGVTGWIEARANALLDRGLAHAKRVPFGQARRAARTREHDFLTAYVDDLASVIDLDAIRGSGIRMGVDPLGGAGVHYWARIAERYKIDLSVISEVVDPTFRFMTLDWDGRIRMDPSSVHAMKRLVTVKDRYDIAFACDTDHDRHGIVTPRDGLLPANHYLAVAIEYLYTHRPRWNPQAAVGKTVVSSAIIDRVTKRLNRELYEVPVGFKWFVDRLLDGSVGFAGEESAGAAFLRRDGTAWTTDKDGIVPALLSAEIMARTGRDPGALYRSITRELGEPATDRIEAPASALQKQRLAQLSARQIHRTELGGEPIDHVLDRAPGNDAPIGGIKVVCANGWFAARPSGTEDIYKIYAESFRGECELRKILAEAQTIVDAAVAATP
jgi:phosphoglucomutase